MKYTPRAVSIFMGADLRAGHVGLRALAQKHRVQLSALGSGECVVFINRARNKIKSYSFNGVISYVRFDDARRGVSIEALDELPRAFRSDGTLDYDRALRVSLEKKLGMKATRQLEVLRR